MPETPKTKVNLTLSAEEIQARLDKLYAIREREQELRAGLTQQDIDIRGACEESLSVFLQHAWQYIDPAPYIHNWHIDAISEHLEAVCKGELRHLLINQPPRTAKSALCSVAFVPWIWTQQDIGPISGPQTTALYASYAQTLSLRDSLKARRLVQSPWYQRLWGNRFIMTGDQNTKSRFENDAGGYRLATSVGSALTGEGGQLIVCLPYEQKILTSLGYLEIGKIVEEKLDVKVAGWDGKKVCWQDINQYEINPRLNRKIVTVQTNNGKFECTEDHPVFIEGRGYVRADQIKEDDIALRILPEASRKISLSFKAAKDWSVLQYLLFKKMAWGSKKEELCKDKKELLRVPEGNICFSTQNKRKELLLLQMSREEFWKKARNKRHKLSNLRKAVQTAKKNKQTLFQSLQACLSIPFHSRRKNRKIYSWAGGIPVSNRLDALIQETNKGEGWKRLHGVWNDAGTAWKSFFARSPHRLCEGKSERKKSYNLMQVLSWRSAWKVRKPRREKIISISVTDRKDEWVYNVNVGPYHNYFVDGFLVHNCDDPHNAVEAESELVRQGVLDWYDTALSTRHNDAKTGSYVVVMQRLHENDLTGHIVSKMSDDWTWLMLPMRYESARHCVTPIFEDPRTEEGELLWPERMGEKEVKALETALGKYGSAGQLQQSPQPKGGGIIKREDWKLWGNPDDMNDPYYKRFPMMEFVVASLDPAYTEKQENDYSALVVLGVFRDKNNMLRVMLMGAWQERLTINDLVNKTAKTCERFHIDKLLIENKASGISVGQEIKRLHGNAQWSTQLVDPRGQDKVARTHAVQHIWGEGIVYAPDREYADLVINQMASFPRGKFDDLHDAVIQGITYLRNNGLILRKEERDAIMARELAPQGPDEPLYDV